MGNNQKSILVILYKTSPSPLPSQLQALKRKPYYKSQKQTPKDISVYHSCVCVCIKCNKQASPQLQAERRCLGVGLLEVLLGVLDVGLDGVATLLPVGGADL
ncbi:hypothetical protein G7K_6537-t1 [Saitoella complicata NRRL Y-17804]|uniref:Uncharacterized protein n=1 Tax=Saitoella complicata (strain BCRC 22490 / CBS 7301 / JCM 7358 / NBRC 10748 / NRRL Y-17804) TaxID=698492 RepID=A0A0E9NRH1_SAICN|nr:hypothetical protein G7K_6537-t1 [Saitoella complicata NRRL Y-17804]